MAATPVSSIGGHGPPYLAGAGVRQAGGTRQDAGFPASPGDPIKKPLKTRFAAFSVISAVENNCTQSSATGNLYSSLPGRLGTHFDTQEIRQSGVFRCPEAGTSELGCQPRLLHELCPFCLSGKFVV